MRVPSSLGPILMAALVAPLVLACSDSKSTDGTAVGTPTVPAVRTAGETTMVPAATPTPVVATGPSVRGPVSYEDAEAAYREKRYDEAVELFDAYVEDRPENPWGHYMRGLSAHKAGQLGVAETAFIRSLELDPAHRKSLVNLARVYLDLDRSKQALDLTKQALELDPAAGDAHRLAGRAFAEIGDGDAAIEQYRQAIVLDDSDAWSMNNLGLILIQDARFEEATPALARAVELRPDVVFFHNNLGIALERSGYPRAAATAYGAALAIDSSYSKAQVNFARVNERVQDTEEDVDLNFLADLFVTEIGSWSTPETTDTTVEDTTPAPGNQPKSQDSVDGGSGR